MNVEFRDTATPAPEPVENKHEPTSVDKAVDQLETGIEKMYSQISWGGIWSGIKKQSMVVLEEVKGDYDAVREEVARFIPEDKKGDGEQAEGAESEKPAVARASIDLEKGKAMLSQLTSKAQVYLDTIDKDLEELENAAGRKILSAGTSLKDILKEAVKIKPPFDDEGFMNGGQDAPSELLFNVPEDIRNQIYSTRLEAQMHALNTSQELFLANDEDDDAFIAFAKTFAVESQADEIDKCLAESSALKSTMDSLVPEKVSYETFWAKYFYIKAQIMEQEDKRKAVLEHSFQENEDEVEWDDSDDEGEQHQAGQKQGDAKAAAGGSETTAKAQTKPAPAAVAKEAHLSPSDKKHATASARPSSESSYDVVSQANSSSAKPDEEEDDWE